MIQFIYKIKGGREDMSLIRCPECGKEVSDQAPVCPGCGKPLANHNNGNVAKSKKKRGCLTFFLVIVFILVGIGALVAIFGQKNIKTNTKTSSTKLSVINESVPESNTQGESDGRTTKGTSGVIGDLELKVNEVAETDSINVGNGYLVYKPDSGKYALVNVTIKNNSKQSESLLLNYFKLIGPDGAEYVGTIIVGADDKFISVDSINPNLDITGNLAFEIPKDLDPSECILKYSDFSLTSGSYEFLLK